MIDAKVFWKQGIKTNTKTQLGTSMGISLWEELRNSSIKFVPKLIK